MPDDSLALFLAVWGNPAGLLWAGIRFHVRQQQANALFTGRQGKGQWPVRHAVLA